MLWIMRKGYPCYSLVQKSTNNAAPAYPCKKDARDTNGEDAYAIINDFEGLGEFYGRIVVNLVHSVKDPT